MNIDNFTAAYIQAALWSSCEPEGEALDLNWSDEDIHPKSLAQIVADCQKFQRENAVLLKAAYAAYSFYVDLPTPQHCAGHDFWLTRNHHGSGFWDRADLNKVGVWDILEIGNLGILLTARAQLFKELCIVIGTDNMLHFEG